LSEPRGVKIYGGRIISLRGEGEAFSQGFSVDDFQAERA